MTPRNPKQVNTVLFDCVPQTGPCPNQCNQCFFNRPGAFYADTSVPVVPAPGDLPPDAIVRVNSGHDSNIQRDKVIAVARLYPQHFFNTAINRLDFPGPVVLTVNPKEETAYYRPDTAGAPKNLMFVRVRVSPSNWLQAWHAVRAWTDKQVPVVLTFMRYYDREPPADSWGFQGQAYEVTTHVLNSYWCPTPAYTRFVMSKFADNRLVSMCSSHDSGRCESCMNCETYYRQTMKRMRGE